MAKILLRDRPDYTPIEEKSCKICINQNPICGYNLSIRDGKNIFTCDDYKEK